MFPKQNGVTFSRESVGVHGWRARVPDSLRRSRGVTLLNGFPLYPMFRLPFWTNCFSSVFAVARRLCAAQSILSFKFLPSISPAMRRILYFAYTCLPCVLAPWFSATPGPQLFPVAMLTDLLVISPHHSPSSHLSSLTHLSPPSTHALSNVAAFSIVSSHVSRFLVFVFLFFRQTRRRHIYSALSYSFLRCSASLSRIFALRSFHM
jgi:hypothetical protein